MQERKEENNRGGKPRRGRWSQAEVARLTETYGLREDAAIARELNRPLPSVRKMAEKIFPVGERTGPWTEEEVSRLKDYLGASKPIVIARILGRSEADVKERIAQLGQVKRDMPWTRDELVRFKRIYGTRTNEDLAAVFGRTLDSVCELAAKHALAKDKAFKRRLKGESSTRMPRWSTDEVELLRRLYPAVANLEIAKRLNRTVKSVVSKAHNLELKKSNERLKEMGRENVSLRYQEDPTAEPVVEIPVAPRSQPGVQPQKPVQPQRPAQPQISHAEPEASPLEEPEVEIPRSIPQGTERSLSEEDQLDTNRRS